MKIKYLFLLIIICFVIPAQVNSQSLPPGFPVIEEYLRRSQILKFDSSEYSFLSRPIRYNGNTFPFDLDVLYEDENKDLIISILPILSTTRFNNRRPYGWGDYGMIPNVGLQQYLSAGVFGKWKFVHFQIQPELVLAENRAFPGFPSNFPIDVNRARFRYWNFGDFPEIFSSNGYSRFWWGQSKITANFGAFEFGVSTQNLWWGPGQWNALTISNNAQGFPHITLRTTKPAKTFLGDMEFQILSGRIEDSGLNPSQTESLNDIFFRPFSGDWKYVNAINFSYGPKWIPGLFLGFNRSFQVYRQKMNRDFFGFFPIFSGITKEQFFEGGTSVDFDSDGADQLITVSFRWVNSKANFEIYGEYGRRDHALNWREFILNPEHARAYLLGFNKLVLLRSENRFVQIRGEITHQQESINRFVRYLGLGGGITWHTHSQSRTFGNFGQPLGVGIGAGSNVQTLEVSVVENLNKIGFMIERLENHQDFYYRAFGQQKEHKPWIDLSLGFLFDHCWNNLLLSSKLQLINGLNYQWQLHPNSTPDFPKGQNLFSVHAQTSLIYIFNKQKTKND